MLPQTGNHSRLHGQLFRVKSLTKADIRMNLKSTFPLAFNLFQANRGRPILRVPHFRRSQQPLIHEVETKFGIPKMRGQQTHPSRRRQARDEADLVPCHAALCRGAKPRNPFLGRGGKRKAGSTLICGWLLFLGSVGQQIFTFTKDRPESKVVFWLWGQKLR